jgi:putative membrane protein
MERRPEMKSRTTSSVVGESSVTATETRLLKSECMDFWSEVFTVQNSVTPSIGLRMLAFGAFATLVWAIGAYSNSIPTSGVAPYEIVGAVLALLLVLRTNSGYDRWYEGRKLWGGIVNQSRNLAQLALAYGPSDEAWRRQFVHWTAAFSHACRHSLRGDTRLTDMQGLLDEEQLAKLSKSQHLPMEVARRLSLLLRQALDRGEFDRFAFIEAEKQRTLLIDHLGACERILKTPLASALSVKIRRFIFLYLVALPFGIFDKAGLMTPMIVMLVAYPLLSLDQIGVELQNPFSSRRLSHLPLTEICKAIQGNLLAQLEEGDAEGVAYGEDLAAAPSPLPIRTEGLLMTPSALNPAG